MLGCSYYIETDYEWDPLDELLDKFLECRRNLKHAERKKEDIKKNLKDLFNQALLNSGDGQQQQPIININVTLNTDLTTAPQQMLADPKPEIVKKEEKPQIGLKKIKYEDRALDPYAVVKAESFDDRKECIRKEIELDGKWQHVDVQLIPQTEPDDDVVILQSDIPVQTFPTDEQKPDVNAMHEMEAPKEWKSVHEMLSDTKEGRSYISTTKSLYYRGTKTDLNETRNRDNAQIVGNINVLPRQSEVRSLFSTLFSSTSHSASSANSSGFFNFQQTSMKSFGNFTETSTTERHLMGHSSKIATTVSPHISPIIAPSCLSISKQPEVWRSTPPTSVSTCEIDTIEKTISDKLKISEEEHGRHHKSMHLGREVQPKVKPRGSIVHKIVHTVKKKSDKLRKQLRLAVVRPKKNKNSSTTTNPSEEPSLTTPTNMDSKERPIAKTGYSSAPSQGIQLNNYASEADNTSPKLDLMLSQKSKKSSYGDITIEIDTDSSVKGNNDDVSNRSLSEIFNDKAMFDSSHESQDPYNILRCTNLPSDLENVSPIMFAALGSDLPASVAQSSTISSDAQLNKMNLTTDDDMKGSLESGYAEYVEKEANGMQGVSSVNPTKEISENSQGKVAQPSEEDNTPRKYVPLPGNTDTIMVNFPKVTCKPTLVSNSKNELINIAEQYGSKEYIDSENTQGTMDSQNASNVTAADPSSDNMHSSNIDVSTNLNETSFQPIADSSNILLDADGNMKQIVYQQTFSGTNITSVIEAAASGIKSPNKTHAAGVDEADDKSSAANQNQSNTNSTSNDVDKSSEITGSTSNDPDKSTETTESTPNDADKSIDRTGLSEQNTTSTNIDSTTASNAQDVGTNNSESAENTGNEHNENDDEDDAEPCNVEVDASEPEISDADNNPEASDGLNEDALLGSQSDNAETQIDLERGKSPIR